MKKMNKKGFTLVELLAVIVILAIVLIIAVPGVLTIIDNSRRDSLISSAKTLKDATRLFATTSDDVVAVPATVDTSIYVPLKCLETDVSQNGFGKTISDTESYIEIVKKGNNFSYKAHLYSGAGEMTVAPSVAIEDLTRANVRAWDSTDKTFTQATADATHIKLDANCKVPTTTPGA